MLVRVRVRDCLSARARPVVALVNTHPAFYTTSSCAGRVSLFAEPTTETRAAGMKGGEWVYVSHDPADAAAIVSAVRRKLGEAEDERASPGEFDPETSLTLRFEPFILSVEAESVEATVKKLLQTLEGVTEYVEKVVKGSEVADPAVVRLLQQLVAAAPRLPTESFGKMFNTQVQDMLTIVYLANLTRTQLALAEKLQAVFKDVPRQEVVQMLGRTAVDVYHFDADRLLPLAAELGPPLDRIGC